MVFEEMARAMTTNKIDVSSTRPNIVSSITNSLTPIAANAPLRLAEFDEFQGLLHSVEESDGYCLALIGKIFVLLPSEFAYKLKNFIGRKIAILRLDGYRFRVLDDKM